jgi:SAM-dependent methyltransferase
MHNLQAYYNRRAREYEHVYRRDDPVRQREQAEIAAALKEALFNRRVLEIACGTGFWTQAAAEVARHVVATDISAETLALAGEKRPSPDRVMFQLGDAYALEAIAGTFDAGLATFWLSHVPRARVDEFLRGFHKRLGAGSIVFMADNVYVPGIGGELVARPGVEDTFKLRTLSDGAQYETLKNYYDADQLHHILSSRATDLRIHVGQCFWWATYRVV